MNLMRAFTHDVESVELTTDECTAFALLVKLSCRSSRYGDEQHNLSMWLASVDRKQPFSVQEYAQRQARHMWRTELRV